MDATNVSRETPPAEGGGFEDILYAQARQRVEKVLTGMWNALGPFDRERLGAVMDGAGDAVANWMPPEPKAKGREVDGR